jgi:hydantoinase/carbamoylase family amidase
VYSEPYEQAKDWVAERMEGAGLTVRTDAVGNLIGRIGPSGPAVVCGSHIDTVPDGGAFDGAFGVLAGIECARWICASGGPLERAFEVVAFADEEGRFITNLGARAMVGKLDFGSLEHVAAEDGASLREAMKHAGLNPERAADAMRPADDFHAYLELHVEQGPVLEQVDVPIGVVTGIVGISQDDIVFIGQADHAGTTPVAARRDAFAAAAEFAVRARELILDNPSPSVRLTFPMVDSAPRAIGVVPSVVRLHKELRELTEESIAEIDVSLRELSQEVAASHAVGVEWSDVGLTPPVVMAPRIQELIQRSCQTLSYEHRRIPSGAGHDAQVIGQATDVGMIFVPSVGGRSHRPDEETSAGDVERGATVLLAAVLELLSLAA